MEKMGIQLCVQITRIRLASTQELKVLKETSQRNINGLSVGNAVQT